MLPVAGVVGAAFSPGGHTLITRHQDGRLRQIDAATGAVLRQFDGPGVKGECGDPSLNVTPNRTYATSGCSSSAHQPVGVWNTNTGGLMWQRRGGGNHAASPDATMVVQGDTDGTVRTVDLATGQVRTAARGHAGKVFAATWLTDGTGFATTSNDRTAIVWDPQRLQPRATLRGHTGPIIAAAFTADTKRLYTAGLDSTIYIWDLERTARLAQPVALATASSEPTLDRKLNDGGTVMVHLYHGTGLLEVDDLTPGDGPGSYTLAGPDVQHAVALDIDATGQTAAIMRYDDTAGVLTARVLDVASRQFRPFTIQLNTDVREPSDALAAALALSADGHSLTTIDFDRRVRRWDTTTGAAHPDFAYEVAGRSAWAQRAPHDDVLAATTGAGTIELIDLRAGRRLATITVPGEPGIFFPVFSPDGRTLAVGSNKGEIAVADTATGQVRRQWAAADGPMRGLAFTPDGRYMRNRRP